jgi:hypothetical protein
VVVEGIEQKEVAARLELEWVKQRCLSLCLLLLDSKSQAESQLLAIPHIEEFLAGPEIADYLRARLFVAPMPDNADLTGAIHRARSHRADRLAEILREVSVCQEEINHCRSAWDALPAQIFGDESAKEGVAFALVQAGGFYQVATMAARKRGAWLAKLLERPEFQRWRAGLTAWINSISRKNGAANRAVSVDEGEALAPGRNIDEPTILKMALVGYQSEKEKVEAKIRELKSQLKGKRTVTPSSVEASLQSPAKRVLSDEGRRRIADATRKRWAEQRKLKPQRAKA